MSNYLPGTPIQVRVSKSASVTVSRIISQKIPQITTNFVNFVLYLTCIKNSTTSVALHDRDGQRDNGIQAPEIDQRHLPGDDGADHQRKKYAQVHRDRDNVNCVFGMLSLSRHITCEVMVISEIGVDQIQQRK